MKKRVLDHDIDFQSLKTTGIKVNYLYVCERKLWLFDRGIQMESKSDKVLMEKLTGEHSYPREDCEIFFPNKEKTALRNFF